MRCWRSAAPKSPQLRKSAPSARIIGANPGKLVAMKLAVVDLHRPLAGQPHHQCRPSRCDDPCGLRRSPPPTARPRPCTIRSSPSISASTPLPRNMRRSPASRSDSFTRNSFSPRIDRRAFGEGGGDRKHRIFVDHGRRARGGNFDAAQRRGAHPQIGDLLAAFVAALEPLDRSAHLGKRRQQAGAQRIEHHAVEDHVRAGRDQRRNQRKRRRGRIGRHHNRLRRQFRLADKRDAAAVAAVRLDAHVRRRNGSASFRCGRASPPLR